jgi:CRISPR-associated protein Cas2
MMVLITYDVNTTTVAGEKRLRKIAKLCRDYGQRVQNSVFECLADPHQIELLKNKLIEVMDKDKDSLRFYYLGSNWRPRIEHIGAKAGYDPEGVIIT